MGIALLPLPISCLRPKGPTAWRRGSQEDDPEAHADIGRIYGGIKRGYRAGYGRVYTGGYKGELYRDWEVAKWSATVVLRGYLGL